VKTRDWKPALWAAAVVALGVALWGASNGWFTKSEVPVVHGKRVERGPLEISVVQRGNLAARDAASIVSEIEGSSTVIFLIKEGTFVKEGDLVAELDSSTLVEKRLGQEISVQNADAAWKKAAAQYEIQKSQNASDIEAAERKLEFARIDLEKYTEGDSLQTLEQATNEILLAEQERKQAADTHHWSKQLNDKGFITKTELERDQLAMNRADINLKQANRSLELLKAYEAPRSLKELAANVAETERGLERAKLRAEAQIADVEANKKASEAKLKLEREKLQKYEDQLAKTKLRAPAAGMVVYSRQEGGGGRMGGDTPMQEGAQVRERQEILQIPREGGMIVEASIHESVLKQVAVGSPCSIKVDSQPGKEFFGRVAFVALLADKGSWWANPNMRVYKTEIHIERPATGSEDGLKELRPGMSCSVEIYAGRVDDCLQVPLQSVFVDKGETIAFVAHDDRHERRVIQVGRSNEKVVEIVSGLEEGEEVLLSAPPGFTPSGADEPRNSADAERAGMPAAMRAGALQNGAPPPGQEGAPAPGAASAQSDGADGGTARPDRPRGPRGDGTRPRGDGSGRRGTREGGERPASDGASEQKPEEKAAGAEKPAESNPGGGQLAEPASDATPPRDGGGGDGDE
jgi:HlyD family secretion protein